MPLQRRCRDPVEAENLPFCRACRRRDKDNSTCRGLLYKFRRRARKYSQAAQSDSIASRTPAHSDSPNEENRRVRHDDATLGHHRLEISIAQSVGDVPAHAQLDDLGIEPTTSVNGISNNRLGHWRLVDAGLYDIDSSSFGVAWTPQLPDIAR